MDHNNILGTVLAGGKSQRFGEDKSQVKLAGKLLIDHMLTEIIDEFKELLIVSNNKINFHNSEKISIIEDYEKGLGPLGGVLSAMKWIKENQKDYKWIATFPVDTPFFKRQILKDFIQNINFNESDLFFIRRKNYLFYRNNCIKTLWYNSSSHYFGSIKFFYLFFKWFHSCSN